MSVLCHLPFEMPGNKTSQLFPFLELKILAHKPEVCRSGYTLEITRGTFWGLETMSQLFIPDYEIRVTEDWKPWAETNHSTRKYQLPQCVVLAARGSVSHIDCVCDDEDLGLFFVLFFDNPRRLLKR